MPETKGGSKPKPKSAPKKEAKPEKAVRPEKAEKPAKAPKEPKAAPVEAARIAVVGIPASGKTTYFRFLSGHFGLNLPILYLPLARRGSRSRSTATSRAKSILEETTYETTDPTDPEGSLETTTRFYVNRPMDDRKRLWVELAAGREEQGVLTKYPLPTKYNQFVEMKMHFRYGSANGGSELSRPMELHTIDEAGGIISDYFTYDRLWIDLGRGARSPTVRAGSSRISTRGGPTGATCGGGASRSSGGSSTRRRGSSSSSPRRSRRCGTRPSR